jgi:uracil-DNA glycosylase family 4
VTFDVSCTLCSRLAEFLAATRAKYPDYHARPVPWFGDPHPKLLVVGLGPGFHGANASGRPFTGDYAGILLYESLHKFRWSNRPVSTSADDDLKLSGARITNAVKCCPPANKPKPEEIRNCNRYLAAEITELKPGTVILALGAIAHQAVLLALGLRPKDYVFKHAARHELPNGLRLFDSYHTSRYNMQTGRLTEKMFQEVLEAASAAARSRIGA